MKPLHINSPLIESRPLSEHLKKRVFLKMETLQPAFSFKIRGLGLAAQKRIQGGADHLITSSGGNAGLALAYAGRKLQTKVTVVVPETTGSEARRRLTLEGAEVLIHGEAWDEAHHHALNLAKENNRAYIHPFDDADVWQGHTSLIKEVVEDGLKPDALVVSVGGGGLMCGLLEGMHRVGWMDVPVIAAETNGAASFARSLEAGRLITLEKITSIATTLGAKTVTPKALEWAKKHPLIPWLVSDQTAVKACRSFLDDHKVLVEPSCGAALSAVYEKAPSLKTAQTILIIVCGGAGVTLDQLIRWEKDLSGDYLNAKASGL